MKKLLRLKGMLFLMAMLLGTSSAWAQAVTVEEYDFLTFVSHGVDISNTLQLSDQSIEQQGTNAKTVYVVNNPVATDETILDLNGRIALDSNGKTANQKRWILRSGSGNAYQNGLVGNWNGNGAEVASYNISVLNLHQGDKVTITFVIRSGKDATPYTCSANIISTADDTAVEADKALASGTQYTMLVDGNLDLYVKDDNLAIQKIVIESVEAPGSGEEVIYGDASIEGEWNFTTDWHYAGEWSLGKQTDTYTATLEGNTVTFMDKWEEYPIVAEFTAENTLTFKKAIVGDPEIAAAPLTQNPFTDGTKVTDPGIDPENFVFETFTATYDPEKGTITFTEGTGLAYGYANKETGEFSYYVDAFDFVSAAKAGAEETATVRRWDFTNWSEATVANLKADAAEGTDTGWSDDEKNNGTGMDLTADNCFWAITTPDEIGGLSANKVLIDELKGLKFAATAKDRALAIAVNYPSTSLGTYEGPSYLWLGGANKKFFTIPAVKAGSTIKMGVESHKDSDARGVDLLVNGESIGKFTPKTYEEYTWTVTADEAVNVVVDNTNGCHIYFIEVEQDQEALLAIAKADLETVIAAVSEIDTDLYTEETVAALAVAIEEAQAAQWSNDTETITEATYALLNAKAALELTEVPEPTIMTYTVNEVAGDIVFRTTEGEAEEGTTVKVPYHVYNVDENGNLYTKGVTNKEYNYSFTLTTDAQEENIEYSAKGVENVVFLSEGEDIETLTLCTGSDAANSLIRSSNSAAAYAAEDADIVTLPAGTYTLHAVIFDSSKTPDSYWVFKAGDTEIANLHCTTINFQELASEEFTITEETTIVMAQAGSNKMGLDLIYIVKTGDVTTGINTVGAQTENGAVYNLQGQKVMKTQKGLYIVNGKKVVIK